MRKVKTVRDALDRWQRANGAILAFEKSPPKFEDADCKYREDVELPRLCKEFSNATLALMRAPAATISEFAEKLAVLFEVQARYYDGQGIWPTKRKGPYCSDYDLAHATAAVEREAKALLGMSIKMPRASLSPMKKAA